MAPHLPERRQEATVSAETQERTTPKWVMVVDVDRCTGCQACVIACQAENNIPINEEKRFLEFRALQWIRIERYWEGGGVEEAVRTGDYSRVDWSQVKVRYIPVLCQQCGNAPCEPVCPVYATYHSAQGLNIQVYNRCIGTRYCANNCPYHARVFNFFDPVWPEMLRHQLNPDVTVRSRGIMEKCTFCVQRLNRAVRRAKQEGRPLRDGDAVPACVQACPTSALNFGNIRDPESRVARLLHEEEKREYRLLEDLGTEPNVIYLKKVDPEAKGKANGGHA